MGNQESYFLIVKDENIYKTKRYDQRNLLILEKKGFSYRFIDEKVVFYKDDKISCFHKKRNTNQTGFISDMIALYGTPLYIFSKYDYDRFTKN